MVPKVELKLIKVCLRTKCQNLTDESNESRQRKNLKGRPRVPNQDGSSTD